MTRILTALAIFLFSLAALQPAQAQVRFRKGVHKTDQMRYERVQEAYKSKADYILNIIRMKNLAQDFENELYIRIIKNEQCLEVWGRAKGQKIFHWFTTYFFCSYIGELGPKLEEGDFQIPEGFYTVDRFNPQSDFHLSMGINYPNKADLARTKAANPGSDIFIHGSCVTVGCVPIGDELIQELYIMVVESINAGHTKIPVHIFPFRMTDENFEKIKAQKPEIYAANEALWRSLQPAYQLFEDFYLIPQVAIGADGQYTVSPSKEEAGYQFPAQRPTEEAGSGR
jgi:murein L,D-transpeptidase YafK